jgi:hypothetical protein
MRRFVPFLLLGYEPGRRRRRLKTQDFKTQAAMNWEARLLGKLRSGKTTVEFEARARTRARTLQGWTRQTLYLLSIGFFTIF